MSQRFVQRDRFPVRSLASFTKGNAFHHRRSLLDDSFEFDTSLIRGRGRQAGSISVSGILLPLVLGGSFALLLYHNGSLFGPQVSPAMAALFLGASMSITAFPLLARLIQQYQIARTKLGTLVLTTASVDDIAAW